MRIRLRPWLFRVGHEVRDLLLPAVCPLCRETAAGADGGPCVGCGAGLAEIPAPCCPGCGGANNGVLERCADCLEAEPRPWALAVSVFPFNGPVRACIHQLKYRSGPELAPWLAARMTTRWRHCGGGLPDAVVPVPLHWFKEWLRGYNQAELLATRVAAGLALPLLHPIRRRRWTRQQAKLHFKDRLNNLADGFAVRPRARPDGLHLLLVDDVMTTGATLAAATTALLRAGARRVSVLTAARG